MVTKSEKWKFNKACESFDLLKVFYPDHIIDGCGPEGWFTSTPYGPVDLLPVEAPQDVMNRYKAMIFLGWNTYDKGDFERIRDYVFHGGTLICLLPISMPVCNRMKSLVFRRMMHPFVNCWEKTIGA